MIRIACIVVLLTSGAAAQARTGFLPGLEDLLPGIEVRSAETRILSPFEHRHETVLFTLSGTDVEGNLGGVTLRRGVGAFSLDVGSVLLRVPAWGAVVEIRGLSATLPDAPDPVRWPDPACMILEAMDRLSVEEFRLRPETVRVATPILHGEAARILIEQDRVRLPCTLSGTLSVGSAAFRTSDLRSATLEDLSATVVLPFSPDVSRVAASQAGITLQLGRGDTTTRPGRSAIGISGVSLQAAAPMQRLFPLLQVLQRIATRGNGLEPIQEWIQVWNGLHLSRAEFSVDAERLRLSLPEIVPDSFTANFSRAGLTTAFGSFSMSARFGEQASLEIDGEIGGVAALRVSGEGETVPVPAAVTALVGKREDLAGLHVPVIRIARIETLFRNLGIDRISDSLFGVPAARYLEELREILQDGRDQPESASILLRFLSAILRIAGDGTSLRITPPGDLLPIEVFGGPSLMHVLPVLRVSRIED